MLEEFKHYVVDQGLFTKRDGLLLALSGGVDSVVLFELLVSAGYHFQCAHVNYQLRGKDSDQDEAFVKRLCHGRDIPLHTTQVNTKAYAKDHAMSIQMAARAIRYGWFEELLAKNNLQYILTAHHIDDSLETVIFNLAKGTGIRGLRGLVPKEGIRIKPLLFTTKGDIRTFAHKENLDWREDASNFRDNYARNKIRHQVIPVLESLNPSLTTGFRRTNKQVRGVEEIWLERCREVRKNHLKKIEGGFEFSISWLSENYASLSILTEILGEFGFSFLQSEQVFQACFHQPGKLFFSQDYLLNLDRSQLIILKKEEANYFELDVSELPEYTHLGDYRISFSRKRIHSSISNDPAVAQLDYSKISLPLKICPWQPGDYFYPLGMTGKKKLSDFLVDKKVPRVTKAKVLVLKSGEEICWVLGMRIDERFKITDSTEEILEAKILNHSDED